ncbi:replicative DNA helicase [Streptomyces acidiscabies]|uniref:Replicative DNA helicase n=1 Tax=Streptomyces acidiscabies TaxID=42234 RepID=A0ABU4MD41_9ACTN|nr:replicative DNA helicase [Streptomyces acidiscabies]
MNSHDDHHEDEGPGNFRSVPPQDIGAEQSTLGGQLLSRDAIADVLGSALKPEDYYRPAHETIQRAIIKLYGDGEPVDPITVASELTKSGDIARVGGAPYLHSLVQTVPTAANAEYYAEIVHEKAVRRRLVEAGSRIQTMAWSGEGEVSEVSDAAQAEIHAATEIATAADPKRPGEGSLAATIDELQAIQNRDGKLTGVSTGFKDLDSLTQGLQPGQLIVVAARPAMGKSTLALDFARACSIRDGQPSVFFSLEMGVSEINMRMLSAEARVALHHMRGGNLTEDDWKAISRKTPAIEAAPLYLDDSADLNMLQIRSKCRRLQQKHGLSLVVVDYLQLMESGKRAENRVVEVGQISRGLKKLGKELGVPVVALSQLNRGSEQRTDKRPQVSDLRESGSIEQDADVVILLHREDAYEKESPRSGEADLIVAKHRNGPTATITVAFQGHYSRFVDMASEVA